MSVVTDKRTLRERFEGPLVRMLRYEPGQSKFARPGHGSAELFLECGHTKFVKNSKVPLGRARCRECRT